MPLLRLLLDPHPDCKLSVPPCSLYSWLPAPAADRAATSTTPVSEEERGLSFQITSSWRELLSPGIKMAAIQEEGSCINFREMAFIDNTLYFIPEDDGDLESDYFGRLNCISTVIRNMNDQVLFVDRRKQPVFEDMTDADQGANEPQTRLIIYMYKDSDAGGLAVTLSVENERMFTLSCKNKVISFQEMDPPKHINDTKSDIIFFERGVPGHNKMQFESSLYKGHFLACEKEGDIFKLILKEKDKNGDKSVMFTVTTLPQS